MASPPSSWRRSTADLLVIAALGACAFHLAFGYVTTQGFDYFYQYMFSPALSVACGGGFTQVDNASTAAFLSGYRNLDAAFACDQLAGAKVAEPDRLQMAHEWLLRAVGAFWRIFGIKWSSIVILSALLFAATIVSSYVMLRAFSGPVAALICSVGFMLSKLHLFYTTGLRDYGKAPFVIAALAICAHLVGRRMGPTRFLALSAVLALAIYVGSLFRSDVIAVLPFALLSIAIAMPLLRGGADKGRAWLAREIVVRGAACALCIAAGLSAAPQVERGGLWGNLLYGHFHHLLEGMGVATGEYLQGTNYNDNYNYQLVRAIGARRGQSADLFTDAQVDTARGFYLDIARNFPGDALTNAVAGVLQVAALGFRIEYLPPGLQYGAYHPLVEWLAAQRDGVDYSGSLIVPSLALIVLFVGSPRKGFWLLALVGWCGLVLSGQWHPRHAFHMEIVTWTALSVLLAAGWQVLRARGNSGSATLVRGASRLLVLAGILAFAAILLVAARSYQQASARAVFSEILRAERVPLDLIVAKRLGTPSADFQFDRLWKDPSGLEQHKYLAVVLNPTRPGCDTSSVWLGLGYTDVQYKSADLSQSYAITLLRPGSTTFFAPVFWSRVAHFHRVFVSHADCLERIQEVTGDVRLLPTLVLAPDWESRWHHARLARYEPAPDRRLDVVDLDVGECRRIINISSLIRTGGNATRQGDSVQVRLPARGMSHLAMEGIELQENDCVELLGRTTNAPVFVGPSQQQQGAGVTLVRPGPFGRILKVARSGRYDLAMEHRGVGTGQPLVEFRADR